MDPFMRNVLIGFVVLMILALVLIILVVLSGQDKLAPLPPQGAYIESPSISNTIESGTGIT